MRQKLLGMRLATDLFAHRPVASTQFSALFIYRHSLETPFLGRQSPRCIYINGESVKSCTMLAVMANGQDVTTIEGIADGDKMHPMQAAFHENHGLQCGFCTPGMVMSAIELVTRNPSASEQEIREGLEGNICRCTGYHNIVKSVQAAAQVMAGK